MLYLLQGVRFPQVINSTIRSFFLTPAAWQERYLWILFQALSVLKGCHRVFMESQSRGISISLCPRRSWILILNLILVCPNVDVIVSGQPCVRALICIYLYLRTHCSTPRIFFQGTRIWIWFWTGSILPRIFQRGGGKAASWETRMCWA